MKTVDICWNLGNSDGNSYDNDNNNRQHWWQQQTHETIWDMFNWSEALMVNPIPKPQFDVPCWCQDIIATSANLLFIGPLRTNSDEISIQLCCNFHIYIKKLQRNICKMGQTPKPWGIPELYNRHPIFISAGSIAIYYHRQVKCYGLHYGYISVYGIYYEITGNRNWSLWWVEWQFSIWHTLII